MSRSNARSRKLQHRPSRIVPAVIVALIVLAIGVLTVIVVLARLINGSWPLQISDLISFSAALTWGSAAMIAIAAITGVLGLVLLIAGIKAGGQNSARLSLAARSGQSGVAVTDFVISNRGIARLAAAQADTIDGVDKVAVSATGRRVHLSIASSSEQTDQIRSRVVDTVTQTLSSTGVNPAPRVSATVRTKEL